MLKKMFLLLVLCCVVTTACAYDEEIRFRGIPWGLNGFDTMTELDYPTYFDSSTCVPVEYEPVDPNDETWTYIPNCSYSSTFSPRADEMTVAGYALNSVTLHFFLGHTENTVSYNTADGTFYLAVYEINTDDAENAYNDLSQKLTSIYGEGDYDFSSSFSFNTTRGVYVTTWYGANNTAVSLYRIQSIPMSLNQRSTDTVSIRYGITNTREIAEEIMAAQNAQTSSIVEEIEENAPSQNMNSQKIEGL